MLDREDRAIRVVVEVDQLVAPPHEHRLALCQDDPDARPQALRPGLDRSERGARPVDRSHALAELAATGEDVEEGIGGHLVVCSPRRGWSQLEASSISRMPPDRAQALGQTSKSSLPPCGTNVTRKSEAKWQGPHWPVTRTTPGAQFAGAGGGAGGRASAASLSARVSGRSTHALGNTSTSAAASSPAASSAMK